MTDNQHVAASDVIARINQRDYRIDRCAWHDYPRCVWGPRRDQVLELTPIWRIASTIFWPCETKTSTCRSFATISSGLYRFLAITVLLDVKDIPQVGPLQWGRITSTLARSPYRPQLGPIFQLPIRYWGPNSNCQLSIPNSQLAIWDPMPPAAKTLSGPYYPSFARYFLIASELHAILFLIVADTGNALRAYRQLCTEGSELRHAPT